MLVVSRKQAERVRFDIAGVHVWLTVVKVDRGKVRLGFEAPPWVVIEREEILPEGQIKRDRKERPASPGGGPCGGGGVG